MYKEFIITSKKVRARKSCYRCQSCACDTNSLILHSRRKLVPLYLLYDDIYSVRIIGIWRTSFRRFWYKYQIHVHEHRCASGVQHCRQARYVLNLTLSCPPIAHKAYLLSPKLIYLQWVQKRGKVVCKLEL